MAPLYIGAANSTDKATIAPKLGTSPLAPATNAAQLKALGGQYNQNGFYWIQCGNMAHPALIWCDMESGDSNVGGIGGWNRFWWYGTYEINGVQNIHNNTFPTGDCFGNTIESLPHDSTYGFGRIPTGITPQYLLVKGKNGTVGYNNDHLKWAGWTFNSSNTTSAKVLASMQSGTTYNHSSTDTAAWAAASTGSRGNWNSASGSAVTDNWWHSSSSYNQYGRGASFNLDDDGAWGNTAFAAGYDSAGSLGVDFATDSVQNGASNHLVLYWK